MKKIYYLINVFMLLSISLINAQTTTVYNFTDGEIISNGGSDDGLLNLTGDYNYHSANYGLNMKDDSSITIIVTGSSTVTFLGSQYSSLDMHAYTSTNEDLGTLSTTVENDLVDTFEFSYTGGPTVLTFELIEPGTDLYLPELTVTTEESSSGADDLIDVWDFGAQQLSNIVYDNQLTETVVNSWYDGSITPGSDGNTLPDFESIYYSPDYSLQHANQNDKWTDYNAKLSRINKKIVIATTKSADEDLLEEDSKQEILINNFSYNSVNNPSNYKHGYGDNQRTLKLYYNNGTLIKYEVEN